MKANRNFKYRLGALTLGAILVFASTTFSYAETSADDETTIVEAPAPVEASEPAKAEPIKVEEKPKVEKKVVEKPKAEKKTKDATKEVIKVPAPKAVVKPVIAKDTKPAVVAKPVAKASATPAVKTPTTPVAKPVVKAKEVKALKPSDKKEVKPVDKKKTTTAPAKTTEVKAAPAAVSVAAPVKVENATKEHEAPIKSDVPQTEASSESVTVNEDVLHDDNPEDDEFGLVTVTMETPAPHDPEGPVPRLRPLGIKDSLIGIFKGKKSELSEFALDPAKYTKVSDTARLTPADADLYKRIFELQDIGAFDKANQKIAQLSNNILMGNVLYQRYMGKYYSAAFDELVSWLQAFPEYAGASDIYGLAMKKKPRTSSVKVPNPKDTSLVFGYRYDDVGRSENFYTDDHKYDATQQKSIDSIKKKIRKDPDSSLDDLEKNKASFDDATYDTIRAYISESYLYNGRADKAYALSTVSADRSKKDVPLAAWIAGLTCWKYGDYEKSAKYFEMAAVSKRSSAWGASASAYWAARSYLRGRQPEKVSHWLRIAAENPRSFYGIIAVKTLGMEHSKFNWDMPDLGDKRTKALSSIKSGKRAIALMDVKQYDLAERELRQINPQSVSAVVKEAMMAVAHRIGSPDFEMRLGSGLKDPEGRLYDSALYPDVLALPDGEYYLDKALIHAFIRQESRFDENAKSGSGAIGLMQLMPATAQIVSRQVKLKDKKFDLTDPKINITLGQRYISDLLKEDPVRKNLFKLAVAYNAGPGSLSNWEKRMNYDNDPLYFIESIPAAETREFVERILANYWIYRLKYGKEIDSLKQIASGEWPMYNNGK